jgi:hypothetical protein
LGLIVHPKTGELSLRQQVVQPEGRVKCLEGRVILLRCGLAAWAQLRPATLLICSPALSPAQSAIHDWPGAELIQLVAGLILSIRLEDFLHA